MATRTAQRVGIWVIAIVLTVGTLAGFIAIILAPKNQQTDQARLADLQAQYQKDVLDTQNKIAAQATQLSGLYFATFSPFASRVGTFDKASVTDLKKEDLKIGDGAEITADTTFSAYYIGWNPDGVIFDQSISGQTLKAPLAVTPGSVIKGWTDGAIGMKVGGVRELTIPAEQAYGATGSGDKIAPNTPIKFVLMIIPTPDAIPQAVAPPDLIRYYQRGSF